MNVAMIGQTNDARLTELSTRLVRAKHQVTIYTAVQKSEHYFNGIRFRHLSMFWSVLHATFVLRPDVMHFHGKVFSILKWIPRFFSPSTTVISTLRAREGVTIRRVATDDVVLEPYKLRSGEFVLSRFDDVKDSSLDFLMTAWKRAREMQPKLFESLKLAIVGDVKRSHVHDASIVFTGFQSGETMKALFAGAKFVVSTSKDRFSEILESMSYGKAVIASDRLENQEVISEFAVPFIAGDVEDLADKIIELAEDVMTTASLGHVARTFVEDAYNWDQIAFETVNQYREAMADRGIVAQYETTGS